MADDYENTLNPDQLPDDDIRAVVRQRLDDDPDFDVEDVDVAVRDGHVTVEGRVGTEAERQHVDQVLGALGVGDPENNVVVDETARAQRPEAADDAAAEEAATRSPLGDPDGDTTATAGHLQPDERGEMFGTRDPGKAVEEGQPYSPPERPTQEGIRGDEQH